MNTAKVASSETEKNHTELYLNEKLPSYNNLKSNYPIELKKNVIAQYGALPLKIKCCEKKKNYSFFKRLFRKNQEKEEVSFLQLFRFSDCFDKILLLIGLIGAFGSALMYPFMFFLYGKVAGVLVDYKQSTSTYKATSYTNSSSSNSKCSLLRKKSSDFDLRMAHIIELYLILGFSSLLSNYLSNVCCNTTAERQIKRIRNYLYKAIICQDMSFFDKNTPGELNVALVADIQALKIGISYKLSDFIELFLRGLACLIMALVLAWKFSIVFFGISPFLMMSMAILIVMLKKYTVEELKAYEKAGGFAQEVLSSMRTILSFGLHKKSVDIYSENLKNAENISQKKGLIIGIFGGLNTGLQNCLFAIGIYYGTYLARTDCENYSTSNIIQSFLCMITATFSLGQALPFLRDLAEAKGAAKKIYDIIDTKSKIDVFEEKIGKTLPNLSGHVQFENVFFSYPQRAEASILKGLNLNIPAGKTVALVGSSGGGKSTLIALLQRFYKPSSGQIRVDGELIEDLDLNWFRSQMALVAQEPILFTKTIKENIRLGRLDATDEEIIQAAKMANAHNFIMATTKKYETEVGERGMQLSGGQKQRIAIARALIRNPKILLLDEATSALDNESEKVVQDALDKAKIGKTTIIIAHRLTTIRNADVIVVLSNGQFKEMGTHDELMRQKGLYCDLVTTQENKPEETKSNIVKKPSKDDNKSTENAADIQRIDIQNLKPLSSKKHKSLKEHNKKRFWFSIFEYEIKLWKLQIGDIFWLIIGSFAQLINGVNYPIASVLFSEIYNIFSMADPNEQERESFKYMRIFFGIAVIQVIVNVVLNYAFSLCGARLTKKLRVKMFEAMIRQEIGFHDLEENRSSLLSTKLSSSVTTCKGLTSDKLSMFCQAISGVGFAIIYAFILNWKLAFLMLIFVPITFAAGVISGRSSFSTKTDERSSDDEGGRIVTETVENMKTIISLGRERHFLAKFESVFRKGFDKTLAILHVGAFFYSLSNSLMFFVQASAFSYGFYLIKRDRLTVTDLFRIYRCLTFSSMTLGRVYSQLPDQGKAKDGAKTAFRIIERKSKIDPFSDEGLKPDTVVGEVKFENVHFHYPNRPDMPILKGFNLICKKGETNALVGPSGCGKSTTIALLLRFYDVESGTVYLDGNDIRKLNINWLRSQIGLVSQEPTLFNYSIYENICFGDVSRSNIPMNEITDVCRQANIVSRIESLPEKYETLVGSRGGQLSGGEKQRVAIARALIRNPKLLLLDEATSALDSQSEQVVQDALDRARLGRTCIVIAHRLSTIQNSDKITVVKDGVVLEEGNQAKLMSNKKFYFVLQTQNSQ